MHHDETVAAIARKLYRFSKKDVAEVLEVLMEIWGEHLLQPDAVIHIKGLGKLRIDEQEIATNIAVTKLLQAKGKPVPKTLKRFLPVRQIQGEIDRVTKSSGGNQL